MKNLGLGYYIFFTIILFSTISFAQEQEQEQMLILEDSIQVNHFNLGVKLGIPNLIGGSAEIVLPVFGNRIAPFIYYSGFNLDTDELETEFAYLEYGANIYFNQKGNGFFIGLGRAQFDTDLTFYDLDFSDGQQSTSGDASTAFNFNTANLKLGIKTGGTIYFHFEVGYGFGDIPDTIDFTATADGITESFSEELPPIPGLSSGGILIGTVGFGVSF